MPSIKTSKSDIIWNYIGTVVSMAGGFVLLPLLMRYLSSEELGLWYVYVAVSNLALLFEFGFNPTFARNIVYVVSGARRLTSEGCEFSSVREGVDWHLLNTVIRASKIMYAAIASVVLIALSTLGTAYVASVSTGLSGWGHWVAWAVFCLSVFINLYFLYSITLLRGYGDVAGENRAKTYARIAQLLISAYLLASGFGLFGASLGYLANGLLLRVFAGVRLHHHRDIRTGRLSDKSIPTSCEIKNTLLTVSHVAWRDGLVQLACYASTQAMSIIGSVTLGLAETGTYSVLLQLGNAVYSFAGAYPKSFFPTFQAAHAGSDIERQKTIVSKSIVAYWGLFFIAVAGVLMFVMPLLPFIKPGFYPDAFLFLALCLYLGLWNQHSIFCNYIISMNEIPYMWGYILTSALGVVLSFALSGSIGWGAWGLVLGQMIPQLLYNNWKWPIYLSHKIGDTYFNLLHLGLKYWISKVQALHP